MKRLHYDAVTGILYRDSDPVGKLNANGYLVVSVHNKRLRVHRIAWYLFYNRWPRTDLDHIDGDKTNNRISNLREVTPSQNGMNAKLSRRNKSGAKGVIFDKSRSKWMAFIIINRKQIYLGRFDTKDEATNARQQAEVQHFGQYRR